MRDLLLRDVDKIASHRSYDSDYFGRAANGGAARGLMVALITAVTCRNRRARSKKYSF